ncbi:MAG: NAD(P)-dependent dehydrogenase (short-subunit alcohol dehydrogenase family) [Candidatus Latescibacterota bacterium]|jgi:NAD(P)-dependent dehydrogenase (short-subunit alcohol dehydrogenase family)
MRLKDRVAIVTGGSSGIGRGICLEMAREGAKVVVADIQQAAKVGKFHETEAQAPTAKAIEEMGGDALFVETDMADEQSVRDLVDACVGHFGALDILVNNAGIHIPGTSQELAVADWDKVIAINLRGPFLSSKFAVPHLLRSRAGRIIHIASVHAFAGGGGPVYPPAKAALVNLTRDTAVELAPHNITVNALCPGYIETPIQDYLTQEQIDAARARTPLPRLGLPKDIGRAAVFFASDDAEWITGTALPVDGGWLAPIM